MSLIAIGHLFKLRLKLNETDPHYPNLARIRDSVLSVFSSFPNLTEEIEFLISVIAAEPTDQRLIVNREFVRRAGVAYEQVYNYLLSLLGDNVERQVFDKMRIHLMTFYDSKPPEVTANTVLSLFVTIHSGERENGVLLHYKELNYQEADFDFFPICYKPAKLSEARKYQILGEALKNIAEIASLTDAEWQEPPVNDAEKARVKIKHLEERYYRSSTPPITPKFEKVIRSYQKAVEISEVETSVVRKNLWGDRLGASTTSLQYNSQPQSPIARPPISPAEIDIRHRVLANCSVCGSIVTTEIIGACRCMCEQCWELYFRTYFALPQDVLCPSCRQRVPAAIIAERMRMTIAACGRCANMARTSELRSVQCVNSCAICTPCYVSLFHHPPPMSPLAITPCPACAGRVVPSRV